MHGGARHGAQHGPTFAALDSRFSQVTDGAEVYNCFGRYVGGPKGRMTHLRRNSHNLPLTVSRQRYM